MLEFGVIVNTVIHLFRPFVTNLFGVVGINMANEPVTAVYRMPYMKGFYDASDSQPGYRIAYLASMSAVDSLSRLLFWVVVWVAMHSFAEKSVLVATFYAAALFSLGILLERFDALRPRST
jgi:hypothetical protein